MERSALISQLLEIGKELDSENYVYVKLYISEHSGDIIYNIQSVSKRKHEISFKIKKKIGTTISIQNLLNNLQNYSEDDYLVYEIDNLHSQGTRSFEIISFEIIEENIYLKSNFYPEPVL